MIKKKDCIVIEEKHICTEITVLHMRIFRLNSIAEIIECIELMY